MHYRIVFMGLITLAFPAEAHRLNARNHQRVVRRNASATGRRPVAGISGCGPRVAAIGEPQKLVWVALAGAIRFIAGHANNTQLRLDGRPWLARWAGRPLWTSLTPRAGLLAARRKHGEQSNGDQYSNERHYNPQRQGRKLRHFHSGATQILTFVRRNVNLVL